MKKFIFIIALFLSSFSFASFSITVTNKSKGKIVIQNANDEFNCPVVYANKTKKITFNNVKESHYRLNICTVATEHVVPICSFTCAKILDVVTFKKNDNYTYGSNNPSLPN